jgi:hypothetical protein
MTSTQQTTTTATTRSKRRVFFGILSLVLGVVCLVGFSSTSYYFGLGAFSAAYGAVLIALGIGLIMKKEPME